MGRSGRLAALALLAAWLAPAQQRPQLTWEGVVDGIVQLSVRGRRVRVEERQGLPVERQRYRFFEPLPDERARVEVRVVEGRGGVRVLQQPGAANDYTLVVGIEDRQSGPSFYSLEFYWENGYRMPPAEFGGRRMSGFEGSERVEWSGRVDGEAVIRCREAECVPESVRGRPVTRDHYRFTAPLPRREVSVNLDHVDGRGEVRLTEQPRERNGYTASVLIRDSEGGTSDYSFILQWARPSRMEEPPVPGRGMVWSGRVDGRIRVAVQGSAAVSEIISGQPVAGEHATFYRRLTAREAQQASIRKLRGRGRVEVAEYPTPRNGYRMVFEIDDNQGGADHYEVEVDW